MTKEELRDHILRQLGVVGAEETPTSADAELCETIIDNCHDELEQLEVASWSVDDIPPFAVESLTLYVKASCQAWGQDYDPRNQELALRRLRYITADRRNGVGRANYF